MIRWEVASGNPGRFTASVGVGCVCKCACEATLLRAHTHAHTRSLAIPKPSLKSKKVVVKLTTKFDRFKDSVRHRVSVNDLGDLV